jgi:2-C-methyl-D-erythritol 4-phosphate cytidylyltransferase
MCPSHVWGGVVALLEGFETVIAEGAEVTDDVSVIEHIGKPVKLTTGSYENLKITTQDDLVIAAQLLDKRKQSK